MKFSLLLVPLLMLVSCSSGKIHTSHPNETSSIQSEALSLTDNVQVFRYRFPNGLKLLIAEDHSSPTFSYQTWFNVGSRDEATGRTGLAHLFEHMMFKETKNLKEGEFDRKLEKSGAQGENAFTSRDYTAYIQELPKDKLELMIQLESERMVNLIVNDLAFKTEREVVQNERRFRNENSPDGLMDQELFHLAFQKHSYHWPIIGYQEDLERSSSSDALRFYQDHYLPNRATIIVAGDVNPKETLKLVQKYYGMLPSKAHLEKTIPQEDIQTSPREKTLQLNIQVEKLLIGFPIPAILSPDRPALDVLQGVLTGGKSSRLNRALVDRGIATSVDAEALENKDPSLFLIAANLQQNRKAKDAQKVIFSELNQIAKKGISQNELLTVKNRLKFSFYENLSSNSMRSYFLGHYETIAGGFEVGVQRQEQIAQVTTQDVQRVAGRYLNARQSNVIRGVAK